MKTLSQQSSREDLIAVLQKEIQIVLDRCITNDKEAQKVIRYIELVPNQLASFEDFLNRCVDCD